MPTRIGRTPLGVQEGGTGEHSTQGAIDNIMPAQSVTVSGKICRTDGVSVRWEGVGTLAGAAVQKSFNTSYLAETDGFLSVQNTANGAAGGFYIRANTSPPAVTVVAAMWIDPLSVNQITNLNTIIGKGNYYTVTVSVWTGSIITWKPLGT